MNYQEFIEFVIAKVKNELGSEYQVSVRSVLKNNSVRLFGLVIRHGCDNISPTIYLEPFYKSVSAGEDAEQVAMQVISQYRRLLKAEQPDISFFEDFERVKELLYCRLVSFEKNRELLKEGPYEPFMDLVLLPYCLIENEEARTMSILIKHEHVKYWHVSNEEIMEIAKRNTRNLFGEVLTDFTQFMPASMLPDEFNGFMYVLTNRTQYYGAALMIYKDIFERFSQEHETDICIIPSSIHEVILIPVKSVTDLGDINKTIEEANQVVVEEEEILSNHAYYYIRNKGFLEPENYLN